MKNCAIPTTQKKKEFKIDYYGYLSDLVYVLINNDLDSEINVLNGLRRNSAEDSPATASAKLSTHKIKSM